MKQIYYAYIVLTCALMVFITLSPQEHIVANDIITEEDNGMIVMPVSEVNQAQPQTENEFVTVNGKTLVIGHLKNPSSKTINMTVPVTIGEKTTYYVRSMEPGEEWQYARINGLAILPKTDVDIDTEKTTYYPTSNQVVIGLVPGEKLYELDVYTNEVPSLVLAKTGIKWSYDYGVLNIKASSGFKDEIIIFFSYLPLEGVVFLEDTKNIENTKYELLVMDNDSQTLRLDLEYYENALAVLEKEISNALIGKNETRNETEVIKEMIGELNQTSQDIENRITANVLLDPSIAMISIVFGIVLFSIVIETFLFKKKGGKK